MKKLSLEDKIRLIKTSLNDTERTLTIHIERRLDWTIFIARSIAKDLERLANNLEKDGIKATFNTLGELQGRGPELDRLLGELGALMDAKTSVLAQNEKINNIF